MQYVKVDFLYDSIMISLLDNKWKLHWILGVSETKTHNDFFMSIVEILSFVLAIEGI